MTDKPFWEIKKLKDFNQDEWESICDNCGKCCLIKIIDEDTNELHYTNVACHLLNFKLHISSILNLLFQPIIFSIFFTLA